MTEAPQFFSRLTPTTKGAIMTMVRKAIAPMGGYFLAPEWQTCCFPNQKPPAMKGHTFGGMMPYKDKEQGRVRARAYRAAHREGVAAYKAAYCATHKEEKAAYDVTRCTQRAAYHSVHREEDNARSRAYKKAHPQENAEARRRHRALKRGAAVGPIDLAAIRIRDRMLCAICGRKVAKKDLSFDHSWPLSLGGSHSQENLRVAHLRHNIQRGAGRIPVQMVLL